MRARLLLLAVALGLFTLQWTREPGHSLPPATGEAASARPSPLALPTPRPWPREVRDPFRFAEPAPDTPAQPGAPAPVRAVEDPPSAPPPVRLVGLVRRAAGARAVLAGPGEVALVGVGGQALGFTVIAIDDEGEVRLRDTSGLELTLALADPP